MDTFVGISNRINWIWVIVIIFIKIVQKWVLRYLA